MSSSILPFDASEHDIVSTKGDFTLLSVKDLIKNLKRSKGPADKPVRLLISNGKVLVAKYGVGANKSRDVCIEDELKNLREIEKAKLCTPHIVKLVWGFNDDKNCIMCIEYIRPLRPGVHTLRNLVENGCDDAVWRQCLFQILYSLITLHCEFPGFRHNDFKADNILVTSPPTLGASYAIDASTSDLMKPLRIRRTYFLSPVVAWVKIIDLEISTASCSRLSSNVAKQDGEMIREYGVSEKHCPLFDLHLMAFDVLDSFPESKMKKDFYAFITQFIPEKLFKHENLTSKYRISLQDQEELQKNCKKDVLLDMASHSYFFFLRGEQEDATEFEVKYKCEP